MLQRITNFLYNEPAVPDAMTEKSERSGSVASKSMTTGVTDLNSCTVKFAGKTDKKRMENIRNQY